MKLFTILAMACLAVPAFAQTTTMVASNLEGDLTGSKFTGKICVTPTLDARATAFSADGAAQVMPVRTCYPINAGVVNAVVPNTSLANPPIGLQTVIQDSYGNQIFEYPELLFTSAAPLNLDAYAPTQTVKVTSPTFSFSSSAPVGDCGSSAAEDYTGSISNISTYYCIAHQWALQTGTGGSGAQADWNATSGLSEILNKPTLATVATSGSYADLSNKPSIPAAQVNSDWNALSGLAQILNRPTLATVATSGSYADLLNLPSFASVSTSGSYTDLINKPSLGSASSHAATDFDASGAATAAQSAAEAASDPTGSASTAETASKAYADGLASRYDAAGAASAAIAALPASARSGSYTDLTNKPTISGSITTVLIAASDSPEKAKADVVCTGTGDETCINNAITTYCPPSNSGVAGCLVSLEDGIYNTAGSVIIDNDDVTLSGLHHCMWGGIGPSLTVPGIVGLGCAQIRASAGGYNIVQVNSSNPGGNGNDTNRHRGIEVRWLYLVGDNYLTPGGFSEADGGDNVHITDNVIQKTQDGIVALLDSGTISGNSIQDISGDAITLIPGALFIRVIHNLLFDNVGAAITNDALGTIISQNIIGDFGRGGILNNYARSASISNNVISSLVGQAISFVGSPNGTVTGNTIDFTVGGYVNGGRVPTQYDAILADSASTGLSITGNTLATNLPMGGYAINVAAATGSTVVGNAISGIWGSGVPLNLGSVANAANAVTIPTLNPPVAITSATIVARYLASAVTGVSNGSPIVTWPDSSGVGRPLTILHGTGPLYESVSNVHAGPGIRFDGATQALGVSTMAFNQNSVPKTMFLVASFSVLPGTRGGTATPFSTPNAVASAFINSSGNTICEFTGPLSCGTQTVAPINVAHVMEWVFDGSTSRVSIDGSSTALNDVLPTWNTGLVIGSNSTLSGEWFPGDMAEIDFYDGAATTTDAATIGAALCATYGVTCGGSW